MNSHEQDRQPADYVSKTEAGRRLGVGPSTIDSLIARGLLEVIRLGYRTVRISAASLDDLPARLATAEPSGEPPTPANDAGPSGPA